MIALRQPWKDTNETDAYEAFSFVPSYEKPCMETLEQPLQDL